MNSSVLQCALESYRGNRAVAEWNLELSTEGKFVAGRHVKAVLSLSETEELLTKIAFYNRLVTTVERRLDLAPR
jgi:hypothetical protein